MRRIESLRVRERAALRARLQRELEADPRVAAAWLHGSFGRGQADAWSDLDLFVVVRDETDPHEYARGALFTVEAPSNAPPGGHYLMASFDAPSGPHRVDLSFQPLRYATKGDSKAWLFDRADWPTPPVAAPERIERAWTSEDEARNRAMLFWAMVLIQAKYVACKPVEDGMGFEGFLISQFRGVADFKGRGRDELEMPGIWKAAQKLDRLLGLADQMQAVAPEWSGPKESVRRFLVSVGGQTWYRP